MLDASCLLRRLRPLCILLVCWMSPGCKPSQEVPPDTLVALERTDLQARTFRLDLSTAAELSVRCVAENDETEVLRAQASASRSHALVMRGFLADTAYTCTGTLSRADDAGVAERSSPHLSSASTPVPSALPTLLPVQFKTAPLPDDVPEPAVTVAGAPTDVGFTLYNYAVLGPFMNFYALSLVIIDAQGRVRWYADELGGADVDAHLLPDGNILFGGGKPPDGFPPVMLSLDRDTLFEATSAPSNPYEMEGSFHHDVNLTVTGDHLLTMTHEEIDDWRGFILKELDVASNTVVWSWSSIQDGVGSGALEPGDADTNQDPYHANALEDVVQDGETFLFLSLEMMDRILKIRKKTGEVVWQLGWDQGWTLLEKNGALAAADRWFFGQHDLHARYESDGLHLTLYDNGTGRDQQGGTLYSRVLELSVDEAARTARIEYEFTQPGWFEPLWGGFDREPDGTGLIARAHCAVCDTQTITHSMLMRVDAQGKLLWQVVFPDEQDFIYRADRIDPCPWFHVEKGCDGR